ncbi:MAG TPA: hypothetical protein VG819_12720 [Rhizomicrobium sp.]|jgi:hypothetical protein|nr:hypothetical protein [Rhizomicrobium sp.]
MRRTTAPLALLLSVSPAFAASFDGVWQGTNDEGAYFRYAIHGDDVHLYGEHSGQFIEDRSCFRTFEHDTKTATLTIRECAADGGLAVMEYEFLLSLKGADRLGVMSGPRGACETLENEHCRRHADWVRVR